MNQLRYILSALQVPFISVSSELTVNTRSKSRKKRAILVLTAFTPEVNCSKKLLYLKEQMEVTRLSHTSKTVENKECILTHFSLQTEILSHFSCIYGGKRKEFMKSSVSYPISIVYPRAILNSIKKKYGQIPMKQYGWDFKSGLSYFFSLTKLQRSYIQNVQQVRNGAPE